MIFYIFFLFLALDYHGTSSDFNVLLFFPFYFIASTVTALFFFRSFDLFEENVFRHHLLLLWYFPCSLHHLSLFRCVPYHFDAMFILRCFHFSFSAILIWSIDLWVMLSFNSISELIIFPNVVNNWFIMLFFDSNSFCKFSFLLYLVYCFSVNFSHLDLKVLNSLSNVFLLLWWRFYHMLFLKLWP